MAGNPIPSEVFDTYWHFAAERMSIYYRRLIDPSGPWTDDPILRNFRFTNAYRATDRVTQYLIREVQYRGDRSQAPAEVFFRTILFKIFNKIETWELLEHSLGTLTWQSTDFGSVSRVLTEASRHGVRIYNAAYIMPSPPFGFDRKHDNHLALLGRMMEESLPSRLTRTRSLAEVYELILAYPGLGTFLAFQYAIDLNYSSLLDYSEGDFVVAGPGALDGISKCFTDLRGHSPADVIYMVADRQNHEFQRLGLTFSGLFGRPLQPIDCQNLFCEISKYARVAHPNVRGVSGRVRIKQQYNRVNSHSTVPFFPPKWGLLNDASSSSAHPMDLSEPTPCRRPTTPIAQKLL